MQRPELGPVVVALAAMIIYPRSRRCRSRPGPVVVASAADPEALAAMQRPELGPAPVAPSLPIPRPWPPVPSPIPPPRPWPPIPSSPRPPWPPDHFNA